MPQCIYNSSNHSFSYFNRSDLTGTFHFCTFFNVSAFTHQYHTYIIFFKVQCDSSYTVFKLYKFTIANITQSVHPGNTITYLQYRTYFFKVCCSIEVAQLLAQYR